VSDLLTEDQIAALVEAAREGHIPDAKPEHGARRPKRVREVDFTRPTKFTQEQQRRLERGHETFCRTVSTRLSAELRSPFELEVINVDQQTWASALGEIPQPSLYAVVETANDTRTLLSVELSSVMSMVERLLGGPADGPQAVRELTEIEVALTRRIFGTIVAQLSHTWEELMQTPLALADIETQLQNIQLVPSSEPTLAITVEVRADANSSTLTILLPHRSIESSLEHLATGHYGDSAEVQQDAQTEEAVRDALRGIAVEVRAEIGSVELTVDEVVALGEGDIVRLGPASAGGTLYADSVPIHRTKPGRSGNRRAVEILEQIEGA
jgi:flagellar motor switch protein FliM